MRRLPIGVAYASTEGGGKYMTKSFLILTLVLSLALSGCATTYNPATGRKEFIFVTTPMEVSIGNSVASQIASEFKISKDIQQKDRLKKIGDDIVSVSDRKDLKYKFEVIDDESLNAFTTPGGYIYVHSGLMEEATDDKLAGVVGHEVGHVAARHIAKKLQANLGYDILMNIAASQGGLGDLQTAASVTYNLVMLGYSREDEMLADRLGVKYSYKAGYDPYAMIAFLKKLEKKEGKDLGFVFLRSHPYASQRIKMLEQEIPGIIKRAGAKTTARTDIMSYSFAEKERPLKVMCPKCRKIFAGRTTSYCPQCGVRLE